MKRKACKLRRGYRMQRKVGLTAKVILPGTTPSSQNYLEEL
jgi:hypothetical protein